MNDIKTLTNRITELETTVAFLDDTVEQLNVVIANQDKQLAEQARLLKMLVDKFVKDKGDSGIEPFNAATDVPPHY